ncbi:MAG: hypothetical protein CM1200mP15_23010 [Dehalococcoidia bacterium]|nr:MAG: hypothetical protein CM1200mP15_23010 [Dehalococcoidia bacterium]
MRINLSTIGKGLDILVSNAGIDCESPVPDLPLNILDDCLSINIRAPFLLCKYALPHMQKTGSGGSIFAVTSGASRGYREGRVGYSMSKAAVDRIFSEPGRRSKTVQHCS